MENRCDSQIVNYTDPDASVNTSNEKPLSPVLNKKRFVRRVITEKKSAKKPPHSKAQHSEDATLPTNSPQRPHRGDIPKRTDKHSSAIPVPIKENTETKQASPKKECFLYNIADKKLGFQTASGRSISISEGTIKQYANFFTDILRNNCSGSEQKVHRENKRKRSLLSSSQKEEIKSASGDRSEDHSEIEFLRKLKQRLNLVSSGENKHRVDMIYENKKFEVSLGSKTTLSTGDVDSDSTQNYNTNNTSLCSSEKVGMPPRMDIEHKTSHFEDENDEIFVASNFNQSQLNYNLITDESSTALENEMKELQEIWDRKSPISGEEFKLCTQETDDYFSNLTQRLQKDAKKLANKKSFDILSEEPERVLSKNVIHMDTSKSHKQKNKQNTAGFKESEIQKTEWDYNTYKNRIKKLLAEDDVRKHNKHKKKETGGKESSKNVTSRKAPDIVSPESKRYKYNSKISMCEPPETNKPQQMNASNSPSKLSTEKNKNKHTPEKNCIRPSQSNQKHNIQVTVSNEPKAKNAKKKNEAIVKDSDNVQNNLVSLAENKLLQIYIKNKKIKINIKSDNGTNVMSNFLELGPKNNESTNVFGAHSIDSKATTTESGNVDHKVTKPTEIPYNLLEEAKKIFEEDDTAQFLETCNQPKNVSYKSVTGNTITFPSNELKSKEAMETSSSKSRDTVEEEINSNGILESFNPIFSLNQPQVIGFTSAAGRTINIPKHLLKEASKKFEQDINPEQLKLNVTPNGGIQRENNEFRPPASAPINIPNNPLLSSDKKFKQQIFKTDFKFNDNKPFNQCGFTTATKTKFEQDITISHNSLISTEKKFEQQICKTDFKLGDIKSLNQSGFSTTAGKPILIPNAKTKFEQGISFNHNSSISGDMNFVQPTCQEEEIKAFNQCGFTTAGGKQISVSKKLLLAAKTKFEQEINSSHTSSISGEMNFEQQICKEEDSTAYNQCGFSTASGKQISISNKLLMVAKTKFEQDLSITRNITSASLSSKDSEDQIQNAEKLIEEAQKSIMQHRKNSGTKSVSKAIPKPGQLSTIQNPRKNLFPENSTQAHSDNLKKSVIKNDFAINDLKTDKSSLIKHNKTAHELIEDVVNAYDSAMDKCVALPSSSKKLHQSLLNTPIEKNMVKKPLTRRRLGMSKCKQISISKEKLEKAKQIFDNIDDVFNTVTPNKRIKLQLNSEDVLTPVRNITETSVPTSTPLSCKLEELCLNITPIKTSTYFENSNSSIVFHEQSCSDFNQLQDDIDKEYISLKRKLHILEERKTALEIQKQIINTNDVSYRSPKLGVLSANKRSSDRVQLEKLFNFADENIDYFNIAKEIFAVTAKNSEKLHFNMACGVEHKSLILTQDGATIIPNSTNTIGLTEINNAFQALEGVDPKLVPKLWVQNHYRWIVWKLASYERKFPQYFKDCLSIDNIVQQLKYRYDREIDKVERSTLRKILEKDDIPQKRLVLCVSEIISISANKFELELTDGWYSIRTIIDPPLCNQIYNNKIKTGTKLMIQGAELIDCDGCHPLEVPGNVRLKIAYNSTRRAIWHLKLGYYKIPLPFPISLKSVQPEGGIISLLKIFIARVYPMRYMENNNGIKIWRNAKAEERRCREFESEKSKQVENIKYKVLKEYDKENKNVTTKFDKNSPNISEITCPHTLYNMLQNTNDPESFINSLTNIQQKAIIEFKQDVMRQKEREVSYRISKQVEDLKMNKRDVIPVLKMLVTDMYDNNEKYYVFNLWRPTEEHMQVLKEEKTFALYNVVMMRKSGELSSTSKTYFRNTVVANTIKKTQRQLLPIAMTVDSYYKPLFNEFDSVGLIIQIHIQTYVQDLWLSDFLGRLLYVKIVDGPKVCALLDNLKRGQSVALSNLILQAPKSQVGQAIGNQCTIITQYPQQKFLQQGLEIFNQQLPDDISKLLLECDNKITSLQDMVDKSNNSGFTQLSSFGEMEDDNSEDNSTIPSKLTMVDIAMSMIDTDQFTL